MSHGYGDRRWLKIQRANLLLRNQSCFWCWKKLTMEDSTVDHLKPKSLGGNSDWSNLVLSCQPCNLARGNKKPTKADKQRRRKVYGD